MKPSMISDNSSIIRIAVMKQKPVIPNDSLMTSFNILIAHAYAFAGNRICVFKRKK